MLVISILFKVYYAFNISSNLPCNIFTLTEDFPFWKVLCIIGTGATFELCRYFTSARTFEIQLQIKKRSDIMQVLLYGKQAHRRTISNQSKRIWPEFPAKCYKKDCNVIAGRGEGKNPNKLYFSVSISVFGLTRLFIDLHALCWTHFEIGNVTTEWRYSLNWNEYRAK